MVDWSSSQTKARNSKPRVHPNSAKAAPSSKRRKVRRRRSKLEKRNDDMRIQKVINGKVKYFRVRRVVKI